MIELAVAEESSPFGCELVANEKTEIIAAVEDDLLVALLGASSTLDTAIDEMLAKFNALPVPKPLMTVEDSVLKVAPENGAVSSLSSDTRDSIDVCSEDGLSVAVVTEILGVFGFVVKLIPVPVAIVLVPKICLVELLESRSDDLVEPATLG